MTAGIQAHCPRLSIAGIPVDNPLQFLVEAARRRDRLEDVRASRLDLRGARLEGLSVVRGIFENCRFDVARMEGAELERVEFLSGSLVCAELRKAFLRSVRFGIAPANAEVPYPRLADPPAAEVQDGPANGSLVGSIQSLDLTGLDLKSADLADVEFHGSVLRYAYLASCRLRRTSFTACDMEGAILRDVLAEEGELRRCRLDGAALSGIRWDHGTFEDVTASTASVFDARFRRCRLLGGEPCAVLRDAMAGGLGDKAWRLSQEVMQPRP